MPSSKLWRILPLLFMVAPPASSQDVGSSKHFLTGGTQVPAGELEAVGTRGSGGCTATLIDPTTVLTAAHCVCTGQTTPTGCVPRSAFTLVNVRPVDDPSTPVDESLNRQNIRIEGTVRVNPKYTLNGWLSHDFATIELDRPASSLALNVQPIPVELPTKRPSVGDKLTLVGFGRTGDDCNSPPMGKRRLTLPVWEISTDNVTLRIGTPGMGSCPGDSGGPAINASGKIVGVSSSAPGNYDPTDLAYNFIAGFATLGGDLASGPAVVSTESGRFDVFIRGKHNDELVQRSWNGTSWSGWRNLSGDLAFDPAVVHAGSRLEVFVSGKDHRLLQRSIN